ncbi:hypothetical protein [Sphingomonas sanxanigenens]|uniref:Uncharacterized protein n=1 Tax=Sphingomonas sanxanigenens DSM 19645 = NX02 TaxID=1123269 RepID=W0ADR7_9SPHN|nr:hypothetical protein [Sphingomonas sanxanigenens]AHE52624.1 hypothetical protein NX02_04380 [Sphingomonas sanxanigenens DSM 19645 = NX02]AHE56019.1 hypothetical protein NX02_21965 [Sphingomonas sanxanigenens DSM 19645 = NX02]
MTTTVTIKTHAWPVEVTTTDDYDSGESHVYTAVTTTVPPGTSVDLYLTSTRSLSLRELPIPHEDQPHVSDAVSAA